MDKKVSSRIAYYFRALRRVRGKDYSLVSVYESELRGALSILQDLCLISIDEWDRLNSLASKLALRASGCGWHSVRQYNARRASRSSATSSVKVIQDEPEQVPAPAAPRQLRVFCVLGSGRFQRTENRIGLNYCVIEYDGFKVDRTDFPRLGKHWSPASVLVGYQERKGRAVCRA